MENVGCNTVPVIGHRHILCDAGINAPPLPANNK